MNFLPEEIEQYAMAHSETEDPTLSQLTREIWQTMVMPRMSSGHFQGRYLSAISNMICPKNILEIGTYAAYSTWCLLEGLQNDGKIITIDINDELARIHQKYALLLDPMQRVQFMYGTAKSILPNLPFEWDLVFIDADKESYIDYYEMILPSVRKGGWILIDNVLWSGKVVEPVKSGDIETRVLVELNERITQDPRVENMLLPIRDGIMMARKK